MRRKSIVTVGLGFLIALAGCGGGSAAGGPPEPLISGTLTGQYKGQAFTATNGFATLYNESPIIGVGDGPLNCASAEQNDPPAGTNAILRIPAFETGTYSSVLVTIYGYVGGFGGIGTNSGTVMITGVTDTSVAGSVSYSFTDDEGQSYSLSGSFEVARCPS